MKRLNSDSPLLFEIPLAPDFSEEEKYLARGLKHIAGIDEAGRGPLAGPVVAATVVLDPDDLPEGLDDSKRLKAAKREALYEVILAKAVSVSVASLSARSIDLSDIRKAALEAMRRSFLGLTLSPDHALIDGRDVPAGLSCPGSALVKGDQRSISIAAASIVAKVTRDRMMARSGAVHASYGFEVHAGYGTAKHRAAIEAIGPVAGIHRYTFAPIKGRFSPS
ncbi:ribonuclease HII [Ochrobactrum sp. Marseille-Q0166]|uniref:ribonuclease HII n=1 Tax=Ochrobactrum sp. Marseille-Q0166 TaxID=2761105 RepID=UPI001654EFC7|nr:ribonuclease HII [Ochrobactrum sp. Marseille-Q0166]MBC8718011.1 ribonuclease HII [Ochrobactrum sp. Marseille-Q0166]